jgi:hypothetical protein
MPSDTYNLTISESGPTDTYILTISEAGVSVPATNSVTNTSVADNAAISFSKLAPLSSGNVIVGSSNNTPTSVSVTGDVTISNTGVTSISSGAIVDGDINSLAGIAHSKLATTAAGSVLLGNSEGLITATPITGDITISPTGVATITNTSSIGFNSLVPVTGAITISDSGTTSITNGSIVDANINNSAAISHSKLAPTTAGNVLLGNSSGAITATTLSGAVTVSSSGVTSIANDAVTFSKIQNISDYQILGRNSGTGNGDIQSIPCTPFAFSLLDDGDAATARQTLGLSNLATVPLSGVVTSNGFQLDSVSILPIESGGTGSTIATGTGNPVLSSSPTINSPTLLLANLGTPASGTLTNCTGLPLAAGTTGNLPASRIDGLTGGGNVIVPSAGYVTSDGTELQSVLKIPASDIDGLTGGGNAIVPATAGVVTSDGNQLDSTATLPVSLGGTGTPTPNGYFKGNGTGSISFSSTIPYSDISNAPDAYSLAIGTISSSGTPTATITQSGNGYLLNITFPTVTNFPSGYTELVVNLCINNQPATRTILVKS